MDHLCISTAFAEIAFNDAGAKDFLGRVEICLARAGFTADETFCRLFPGPEMLDLPYAQRFQWVHCRGSIQLYYKNARPYIHHLLFVAGSDNNLIDGFNLLTRFQPYQNSYTRQGIEEAYLLQSLAEDIYHTFPDAEVTATTPTHEDLGVPPWFKFSAEGCIKLGTFERDVVQEKWLEENPHERDDPRA